MSDYLTAYDDPARMMAAAGKPVVSYTYRLSFRRPAAGDAAEAAATALEGVPT